MFYGRSFDFFDDESRLEAGLFSELSLQFIEPIAILSEEAFGLYQLNLILAPGGAESVEQIDSPRLNHTLYLLDIDSEETIGISGIRYVLGITSASSSESVVPPQLDLNFYTTSIETTEVFGNPKSRHRLYALGFGSDALVVVPKLQLLLHASGIPSAESISTSQFSQIITDQFSVLSKELFGLLSVFKYPQVLWPRLGTISFEQKILPGVLDTYYKSIGITSDHLIAILATIPLVSVNHGLFIHTTEPQSQQLATSVAGTIVRPYITASLAFKKSVLPHLATSTSSKRILRPKL